MYAIGRSAIGIEPIAQTRPHSPRQPRNLSRTGLQTDTTPNFSVYISDYDNQQIKATIEIYQSDGVTLVSSVDTSLGLSRIATAELASALPVGTYRVQAKTVDDGGSESSYTAQSEFLVTEYVDPVDSQFIWHTKQTVSTEETFVWHVTVAGQKDLQLVWNTKAEAEKILVLDWQILTYWEAVDYNDTTWTLARS